MTRRGWALFVALGVIWGIPYLLIKVAVSGLSPTTLVLLRTAEGALLVVPIAAARGSLTPLLAHWRAVVVYTLVEVAVPWLLLSNAETHLTSSLTGLLIATVPLIGAVLGLIIGAEDRLDLRRTAGLLIGFAGVAALLGLDFSVLDSWAAGPVGLVTLGYALGPMVLASLLRGVSRLGLQ